MFPTFSKFGDALDRADLGGWLMLLLGFIIIAATVFAPPFIDNLKLQAQNDVLRRQADILQLRHQNYLAFNRAVERGEPVLIQRIAWQQLHLKPVGTEPLERPDPRNVSKSIDAWMDPPISGIPLTAVTTPDTRLVRLLTGKTRPWVLAFGGWLLLMGAIVRPSLKDEDFDLSDTDSDDAGTVDATFAADAVEPVTESAATLANQSQQTFSPALLHVMQIVDALVQHKSQAHAPTESPTAATPVIVEALATPASAPAPMLLADVAPASPTPTAATEPMSDPVAVMQMDHLVEIEAPKAPMEPSAVTESAAEPAAEFNRQTVTPIESGPPAISVSHDPIPDSLFPV